MEPIINSISILSLWSFLYLIYSSFHFVTLGKKYDDKSIQVMGWSGFLLLAIPIIVIVILGDSLLMTHILVLVFSVMLAIYIGILAFNSYKKFNNTIIGLFGIPMIFVSVLMGIAFLFAYTSNDWGGALAGAFLFLPPLGVVLIITAKMTSVFLSVYKKEKKHDMIYKMTGRKING